MPITITQQPATGTLLGAYRPTVVKGVFPLLTAVINRYSVGISNNGNRASLNPVPAQSIGLGSIVEFSGGLTGTVTVTSVIDLGAVKLINFSQVLSVGSFQNVSVKVNGVDATYTGQLPPPPVAFLDVYFNGIYYKTLSTTSGGFNPAFDMQDAVKEFLTKYLGVNGSPFIRTARTIFASCEGRIRGSSTDQNGFLIVDQPVPIQATGGTPAVAGGGVATNSFFVVNSALQHEDHQSLITHLNTYKTRVWSADSYPLSHRKDNYKIAGSDYFPFAYLGPNDLTSIRINYTLKDGTTGTLTNNNAFPICPIITGIDIQPTANPDGINQTFTFIWNPADPLITGINIMYSPTGLNTFTTVPKPPDSGQSLTLPLGFYDFKFEMVGSCTTATSGLTVNKGIAAPPCVVPTFIGGLVLHDWHVGEDYTQEVTIAGSQPFNLTGITKPAWMNIDLVGNKITFSGQPVSAATDTVAFTVNNACGSLPFSQNVVITNLARTLTISFTPSTSGNSLYDLSSKIRIRLNAPINAAFAMRLIRAQGFGGSVCAGSVVANSHVDDLVIPIGQVQAEGNSATDWHWGLCNSYRISEARYTTGITQSQAVFPGSVVTIGSYNVTILFTGC